MAMVAALGHMRRRRVGQRRRPATWSTGRAAWLGGEAGGDVAAGRRGGGVADAVVATVMARRSTASDGAATAAWRREGGVAAGLGDARRGKTRGLGEISPSPEPSFYIGSSHH